MSKLKVLSGKDIVKIFEEIGFHIAGQKGSHLKLKREIENNHSQTLTIPNHQELDKGTIKAIDNQSLKYIPESDLRKYFYTK
jgi:predicted RNA binding protein YcfA (HicA-like mRNA interferase family)